MEIDFERNELRISVVELASFERATRSIPRADRLLWRAQVGQEWHKVAEQQTRSRYPEAEFEKTIRAKWIHRNWTFVIQGRIDQVIPLDDSLLLNEVKTVRVPLPITEKQLVEDYSDYIAQAQIYWKLCQILPEFERKSLRAELTFFDIDHATVQKVPIHASSTDYLSEQVERVVRYLEARKSSYAKLRELEITPPFEVLREGQATAITQLGHSLSTSRITLFNAPTGFGKTGIILQQVLTQMQLAGYERCIYLTSRSTGQTEVAKQVKDITSGSLRWIQMRNREEHRISEKEHPSAYGQDFRDEHQRNWANTMVSPRDLFREGTFELDRAKELGERWQVDPYELTRSCLPYSDFWLGDFNYIFSPSSRSVFVESLGYDPSRTILVVDEAHNLPERVASAYKVEIEAASLVFAAEALIGAKASQRLQRLFENLSERIASLPPKQELETRSLYELLELCEEFARVWDQARLNWYEIAPFALDSVRSIHALGQSLDDDKMDWFHWCPAKGIFRADCLSPELAIQEALAPFGKVILQSATLDPIDSFTQNIGLDRKQCSLVRGMAKWRENAYEVAIDLRVDTRLRTRGDHYETTARTLAEAVWASNGRPAAAFFPSYSYADSVQEYLSVIDPSIRVGLQDRGGSLSDREDFVLNSLRENDLLLFIIGSHYSEGIDQLGGEIDIAVIVGPALSEMNLLTNHRIETASGRNSPNAFREVCAIPAMQRIHQALGRLVRAPEQQAKILLHCSRFSQATYRDLILPEYFPDTLVKTEEELQDFFHDSP